MNADSSPTGPKRPAPGQPAVTIQNLDKAPVESMPGIPKAPGAVTPSQPVRVAPSQAVETVVTVSVAPTPFIAPPPLETQKENFIKAYWKKAGGGSLIISLLIHVGLLAAAAIVVKTTLLEETPVDFLPGGGSKAGAEASDSLARNVQMKKRSTLNKTTPMSKVVSRGTAAISLPEAPIDAMDMPEMSSAMGGGVMGSAGFGSGGSGGGFGLGNGIGGAKGVTFKPIVMFGKDLKARKIAVILDVSGSMTPHLTKVVKELDRVASGSRVMLYVGCGVATPEDGVRLDRDAHKTTSKSKQPERDFELFWRRNQGAPKKPAANADPKDKKKDKDKDDRMTGPIPQEEVYAVMASRQETYFMKSQGIQYAWIAVLARELQEADALYWFSDFQDRVDDEQIDAVLKNLKRRKQKLFIHASNKGNSFEKIRDQLCIPSGGEVIETDPPKDKK